MNKSGIIESVATKTGLTKKAAEAAVNAMLETITENVKAGEDTAITGFGVFGVKHRAARTGRNPKTKEVITIPESRTVSFKNGKILKDAANS